jgi:hypothetical protein
MSEESSPVRPGDTLAGKYCVERVLGVGGMGVVVAATHLELGQKVALKFLLPHALQNPEAAARFLREARAAVKIVSEHVARVTDVGRLENGAPYMVMEYLEGGDLSDCPKGPSLPVEDAIDFLLQACEALAVAHSLGIVHRDLKPANLFLTTRSDGAALVKVLDFGISKLIEPGAKADLTQTSAVMGSPLYMSPEQMRSARSVDVRTDIWALGTILHELIAGTPPFIGETLGEVFANVMTVEATPLRQLRPDVPERVERIVLRALAKDPAQRFQNVAELALALADSAPQRSRVLVERVQGVLGRVGIVSSPAIVEPAASAAAAAATDTSWADSATKSGRSAKTPVAAAAAFAVLALAAGGWFVSRGHSATAAAAPSELPMHEVAPAALPPPAVLPASTPAVTAASTVTPGPAVAPADTPLVASASSAPSATPAMAHQHAPAAVAHSVPVAAPTPAPVPSAPAAKPPVAPVPHRNPLSIDFK